LSDLIVLIVKVIYDQTEHKAHLSLNWRY